MLLNHRKFLILLAAALTFTFSGCALVKKDLAKASYVSKPNLAEIKADADEVPTKSWANNIRPSSALARTSSSCGSGFS